MRVSPLLYQGLVALNASGQPVVTARNLQVLGSSVGSTAPVAGDGSAMGDWVPLALPALAMAESRFERHACVRRHRPPDHPWSRTLDARHRSPLALAIACCGGAALAQPAVVDPGEPACSENRAGRHGPGGKGKGPPGDCRHESPCDPTLLAKRGR